MKRLTVIVHKNPLNQSICCSRKAIHQAGTLHSQIKLNRSVNVTSCFVCGGRDFAQESSNTSNTSPGRCGPCFIQLFHFIHKFPNWNIFPGFYFPVSQRPTFRTNETEVEQRNTTGYTALQNLHISLIQTGCLRGGYWSEYLPWNNRRLEKIRLIYTPQQILSELSYKGGWHGHVSEVHTNFWRRNIKATYH